MSSSRQHVTQKANRKTNDSRIGTTTWKTEDRERKMGDRIDGTRETGDQRHTRRTGHPTRVQEMNNLVGSTSEIGSITGHT